MQKDESLFGFLGKCVVVGLILGAVFTSGCVDEQVGVVEEGWLRLQLTDDPGGFNITAN